MAKRGVLEHPKTLAFADALGIMDCFAVGVLEVFWHWVAKYHPDGDVSGTKPSIFARSVRYQGDANELWSSLLAAGFIDVDGDRLVVHDWSEHADNSTHQLLKKRGETFADGFAPFSRTKVRESKTVREPEPIKEASPVNGSRTVCEPFTNGSSLPEPEPEPEPERERDDAPARLLTVADGMAYWDRDSTSEPLRSVAKTLCRAAELFEQGPPAEDICVKGAREGSAIRKVIAEVGWEEAAEIHVWAVRKGKGDTFVPIWNNLAAYRELRKNGTTWVERKPPPVTTRKPTLTDQNANLSREILDRALARNEITKEEYDRGLAATA